jgi:uncharacterized protein YciI
MNKMYFFVKLNPSRADFAQTMTDEERSVMQAHSAYWKEYMNQGKVVVFGPVLDPKGVFGMGVVGVGSEEDLLSFIDKDPAASLNTFEYYPMRAVLPETAKI